MSGTEPLPRLIRPISSQATRTGSNDSQRLHGKPSQIREQPMTDEPALVISLPADVLEHVIDAAAQQAAEPVLRKLEAPLDHPRWLNLRQAAEHTGMRYGTIQKLASARKLPGATKPGKHWVVDSLALDEWLQTGAVPHRPAPPA